MVVSRSDSKRRKKGEVDPLPESPKRTKVHAQRKFAQGSHLNSPVLTPVKDKDKTKYNGSLPTAELLPIKRPKTEEFVNFLCFRGSDMLPKALEFFNEPSVPEPMGQEEERRDGASSSTSRATNRVSDKHADQAGCVAKAEARNKNKSKSTEAVQALKKKYQEQRLAKEKRSLTKLALKVKGKSMMRTRSAGPLEEKPTAVIQKKTVRTPRLVSSVKAKTGPVSRKPVLRKHPTAVKRLASKPITRGGLRSGGELPPGSEVGLKTERKPRKIMKLKAPLTKSVRKVAIASSLSDFSSDDDQPLVKKQRVMSKAAILANRITTRSRLMSKPTTSQAQSSRPTRKTKEAATLFMEMLGKDLRSPDEEDDNVDAMSVDSFVETLKRSERKEKESKEGVESENVEKKLQSKSTKKECKPNENKLSLSRKNSGKLPNKLPGVTVSGLTSLKSRTLRRNSYRLVSKEIESKRLKSTKTKLINKLPSRSSSKETYQDLSIEAEKTPPKGPSSDRDIRRERRSLSNASKTSESKVKQQKKVTKESDSSSSKTSKQKKALEETFDDSDEEPLGNKVNQNNPTISGKVSKKAKSASEKEETSINSLTDPVEQKVTRRKSLNVTQDISKEELKSSQSSVRTQQSAKKTSLTTNAPSETGKQQIEKQNENNLKVKSEPPSKPKASDNNSGNLNLKSKETSGKVIDNGTHVNQNQNKESEKNSNQHNKIQNVKKVKKTRVKETNVDNTVKSHEENNTATVPDKKKQANKTMKKIENKKTSDEKGGKIKDSPKERVKVTKPKCNTEKIDKKEEKSVNKSNVSGKNLSKKNVTASSDGVGKNKNCLPPPVDLITNITGNDIEKPSDVKCHNTKKTNVKCNEESTDKVKNRSLEKADPLQEVSIDIKNESFGQSTDKPVVENQNEVVKLKLGNKIENQESDGLSSANLKETNKKELNCKKSSANESFTLDSASKNQEKLVGNKVIGELNKNDCSASTDKEMFKGNNTDNNSQLTGSGSISVNQKTVVPGNIAESLSDKISSSEASTNVEVKSPDNILSQKLTASLSPHLKSKNIKGGDQQLSKNVMDCDDSVSKRSKVTEVDKVCLGIKIKPPDSRMHNNLKKIPAGETSSSAKGILLYDLKSKEEVLESKSNSELLLTNPKLKDISINAVGDCNKNQLQSVTSVYATKLLIPEGLGLSDVAATNTNITNNNLLVSRSVELKDIKVPSEISLVQLTEPSKPLQATQRYPTGTIKGPEEKLDSRCVSSESTSSKKYSPQGKCLAEIPAPVLIDLKGQGAEHTGTSEGTVHIRDFKTDGRKLGPREESYVDSTSKISSLEMSDKISSAVDTLMSLKNVQKIDERSFSVHSGIRNVKSSQNFEIEQKRTHEGDPKQQMDNHDTKKVKLKDGEIKRVTIQEPEFKRFNAPETDIKRTSAHESDFKRFHMQDHKPKQEHPQVLKGCSNPKSMLKPGTLIDIAGISHSPEIMTPLRPGVDGEIIPMNRPIRPMGPEMVDPFKANMPGFKPYEPRAEHNPYGYRWQTPSIKPDQLSEKEASDSKSRTPVNESAWRQAFKNVKDPKSSNNVPAEKPAVKKQLSVTALAKRHNKSKTEVPSDKNTQSQPSIPFLRQSKPFLGPSPTKNKSDTKPSESDVKKNNTDIDYSSLREKEAEVEEFLRQYVTGEFTRSLNAPPASQGTPSTSAKVDEEQRNTSTKPSRNDSKIDEASFTHSKQIPLYHDQSNVSLYFASDSVKRASSPLKHEKPQLAAVSIPLESSITSKSNIPTTIIQQDQIPHKQSSSLGYQKHDQSINIFQSESVRRSNSPNLFQSESIRRSNSPKLLMQKNVFTGTDIKSKLDDSSVLSASSSATNSSEQISVSTSIIGTKQITAKQSQPDNNRHFSPSRSYQNPVPDNLFKDTNITKRTKSPTLLDPYSQPNSSPKGNFTNRNTSSPVFGKCSQNIFKEIVPAKRSYSPTLTSSNQTESEAVPNIFTQNPNFRRSVSPLSNRTGFAKVSSANDPNVDFIKKSGSIEQKQAENVPQDNLKYLSFIQPGSSSYAAATLEQNLSTTRGNQSFVPTITEQLKNSKASVTDSLIVKEEIIESDEAKNIDLVSSEDNRIVKQDVKPYTQKDNENLLISSEDVGNVADESNLLSVTGTSEAKHRLPLPVEQTLKKLGQARSPPNKKIPQPQKVKSVEQNVGNIQHQNEDATGQKALYPTPEINSTAINIKNTSTPFANKLSTGIYSLNQEGELDLMPKKKVNMSAEEIKRWLNDSSTSEIEHRVNCGILENNACECEYRNTLPSSLQNIDTLKFETVAKVESICSIKPSMNQFDEIDTVKKSIPEIKLLTPEVSEVKKNFNITENKKEGIMSEVKKEDPYSLDVASELKPEVQKSEVLLAKTVPSNDLKESGQIPITKFDLPISNVSSENVMQSPTTSPASKLRTFRLPNKNIDVEQKPNIPDTPDISIPARDDASSSNDVSSSNEETPEKSHPERKSIFQQRRSTLKVKERRELIAPSVNAFSPENESSVYAFDPELPPTSTPFRRSKGKDGKSTSTTTDDEELTPNSASIAVQVNFDNEAVLECSTQTDVQEGDDDDTHTFYIPLQQSTVDTTKPPLIQGVAVKVDTEGPDQKVIMRAKLVTKPLSTFNQSSSTPRALIGSRSGKPEQKVRPLSVKPPVGTVQPTARPKPKPPTTQDDQPGPSKASTCSPQAARLAKRIKSKAAVPSTSAENHPPKVPPAKLVEAPTFYPTEKEFEDPLEYISSITPQAEKYGLCRVVPPPKFKPECKVSDDMRFTAYNQYIHKMLHRWGPNVKEMLAIKKYLATQSIALTHPPWIGGMEVDLPRLYQTVQQCGGLKEVIEKKRWHKVADMMKIPKSAQDRVTKLDDIYCKFLLPYDTLSHAERTQLFEEVERDWIEREKRVNNQQEASDDDEDSDSDSDSDIDECIVKGRSMALSGFYRIARNTMSMWFPKTETPSAADVELEFWKHVASRQHHVCVHSGSIDSGAMGYGFPTGKNSSTSRHPWNLKMLTNNPGSILRFLGPIMGVTVPTLHVGMLFSACCWYRDPHGLPWIEYLHTGASKIWYGIPDSSSNQFRDAVMNIVPRLCRDKTLWLASDTAMVPPPLLVERGVSLSRIVQDPGQFIIVFPKAFTSSICTGYLVSESVYFAQPSWLSTAQALFNDMRETSEPTVFSLEKLLFSIVNDSRASAEVLSQILPIVVSLRDGEIAGRRQLEELGLNSSERLNSKKKSKSRPANEDEEDYECEDCRMTLFISFMSNSHDNSVYCLPHAVELLSNKRNQVKHCTLVYAFSEEELEELVEKLKSRAGTKTQKKCAAKGSRS